MKTAAEENPTIRSLQDHPDFDTSAQRAQLLDTPECPAFLSETAKTHWADIVPNLTDQRIVNSLDKDVLTVYCSTYAQFIKQDTRFTNNEFNMITATPKGYTQLSADYVAWRDLGDRVLKLAKQLGLTPPARLQMRLNGDAGQGEMEF